MTGAAKGLRLAAASITRRGAVAAIAAAFAAPAIAAPVAGPQSPIDATALRLWAERQDAVERQRAAVAASNEATARLPAWAQSGPRSIDHEGKPCGQHTGWPLDETVTPSSSAGAWRVVRPSPADYRESYRFAVDVFKYTGKARRRARNQMNRGIAAINARVAERGRLQDELGITDFDRRSEVACSDIIAAEDFFRDSADTAPNIIAAQIMIHACDDSASADAATGQGYCGVLALALIALKPLLPDLSGLIRDHAAFYVANPETPLGSMPFAPV